MNKTEREVVEDLLEWVDGVLQRPIGETNRQMGYGLVDKFKALLRQTESDIYLVVCENGFARGVFSGPAAPTIPQLENCAKLRNTLCTCGGGHRIIRAVQQGTGRKIE